MSFWEVEFEDWYDLFVLQWDIVIWQPHIIKGIIIDRLSEK
jgi:hypothetical protein